MSSVIGLVDDALYRLLSGFPPLNQMVGGRVYALQPPPGASLPYVLYQSLSGGYTNTSPRDDIDVTYQIVGWSPNRAQALTIGDQIIQATDNEWLAVPGWSNYWLNPGRFINQVVWTDNTPYYGIGAQFDIRADRMR